MGADHRGLTFHSAFAEEIGRPPSRPLAPGECKTARGQLCPLCYARPLEYAVEAQLRQAALQRWWRGECALDPLVESPRGRDYRTVSKRRMLNGQLGLIDERQRPLPVGRCRLEPPEHQELYDLVGRSKHLHALRPVLNFAIVKGNYEERWLLLNVSSLAPAVVAAARKLSVELGSRVAGFFLLEGRVNEDYYLSHRRTLKIFGHDRIRARLGGRTFLYPVTVFSQVNHSLVDELIARVQGMLTGKPLLDLYCGYGLFSLTLEAPRVTGLEWSQDAVQAAQTNARRFQKEGRFKALDLTADRLVRELPRGPFEAVIDPPRGGPAPGVIAALASRRPSRVVHLFCDVERVPVDLADWRAAGYRAVQAVPFDLFPGTSELEVAVLLEENLRR